MSQTLYAVLVGITEYPIERLRLPSCTNDAKDMNQYLEEYCQSNGVQYQSKILLDRDATREGIIQSFKHFETAKDGDICLFYFSGHGSQSKAPKEFWTETDGMLESLVCYDSRSEGGYDLVDKEFGGLIWTATQNKDIHFVAILDSCHSGDISKAASDIFVKNAPPNFELNKSLGEFHGYSLPDDTNPYHVNKKGISVKASNHIVISAAKDYETAKVVYMDGRYRSVFTHYFLQSLKQNGADVSYGDLVNRVRIKTENTVSKQTPQVEGIGERKKSDPFLNSILKGGGFPYLVAYDKNAKQWKLNAGGVQGIRLGTDASPTQVELENGLILNVSTIHPNSAFLDANEDLNIDKIYTARIHQMRDPELKIHITDDSDEALKKELITQFESFEFSRHDISIVEKERDARFIIRATEKTGLCFCKQGETETIFEAVDVNTSDPSLSVIWFLKSINHVLSWYFVLDLQNEKSGLAENSIAIGLKLINGDGSSEMLPLGDALDEKATLRYSKNGDEGIAPNFNLSIKNTSGQDLTISVLFMSYEFAVTNVLLPKKDLDKDALHSLEYYEGDVNIPIVINENDIKNGIREVKDYLKIIVRTRGELETDSFNQEELKSPNKDILPIDKQDWRTYNIPLTIIYPSEQKTLVPDDTNDVDLGMCSVASHSALAGKIQLKSVADIQEKSVNNGSMLAWNSLETQGGILSKSASGSSSTDILEITEIPNKDVVNADNPLVLDFKGQVKENEGIYPFGFDSEIGLWYPLGKSEKGQTIIEKLPISDANILEKGLLTNSVKIYLKKITGIVDYPLFQYVDIGESMEDVKFKDIEYEEIQRIKKAKNIVLFVHGILSNNLDKPELIHMAEDIIPDFKWNRDEDVVLAFDYESLNTTTEKTSENLLYRLQEIRFPEKTEDTNYILIAHSMGGIISRFLLEQKGGNKYFNHFIQVGTPNNGSPLATIFKGMEYGVTFALNYFIPKQYSFPLSFLMKAWGQVNNTAYELATASDTCKKLNTKGKDPEMPYHIILGDLGFDGDETSLRAMRGVEEALAQQNRIKKLLSKIETKSLDALLGEHGAHDGIVPVKSMRKVLTVAAAQDWTIQPKAYSAYSHHFKYFCTEPGVGVIGKLLK